jgi:2-iminobutanoate/2-iminopropanoate deaminase
MKTIETRSASMPGGPYAQGVVADGPLLFVAGQGPIDPQTGEWHLETFAQQMRLVLSNVLASLTRPAERPMTSSSSRSTSVT